MNRFGGFVEPGALGVEQSSAHVVPSSLQSSVETPLNLMTQNFAIEKKNLTILKQILQKSGSENLSYRWMKNDNTMVDVVCGERLRDVAPRRWEILRRVC